MESNPLIRAWKHASDLEEFFRLVGVGPVRPEVAAEFAAFVHETYGGMLDVDALFLRMREGKAA